MSAQIALLKADHASSERWQATTARGQGYKNAGGLLPIDLFLNWQESRFIIKTRFVFWAPTLPLASQNRYRGLEIIREGKTAP